jgi:beta-N-acetylhexosaminidase
MLIESQASFNGAPITLKSAALAALHAGCDMVLLCNQSLGEGLELDALIDGLAEAQVKGRWQPSEASELRRLDLLPKYDGPSWDALMVQPAYMRALDLIA